MFDAAIKFGAVCITPAIRDQTRANGTLYVADRHTLFAIADE